MGRIGTGRWVVAAGLACVAMAAQAQSGVSRGDFTDGLVALTSNTSAPSNWRVTSGMNFNGVSFDGVARLAFDSDGSLNNGFNVCSGTLLSGGQYVLTAAHCADNFNVMQVDFGVYGGASSLTRGVSAAYVNPNWVNSGVSLANGSDIAILKLDAPVTTIQGFNISTTNDTGSSMLVMGYGTTGTGGSGLATNWDDWGWAHWGRNEADVGLQTFDQALWPGAYTYHGDEYIFDFDNGNSANNTLDILAGLYGNQWTSSNGLGTEEALTAGGDSGGGDFVWTGTEWRVSGVHSWGAEICGGPGASYNLGCDVAPGVLSSYGDLSGSSAVFTHAAWINSVTGVPEPETYAMMIMGLGVLGVLRRRQQRRSR